MMVGMTAGRHDQGFGGGRLTVSCSASYSRAMWGVGSVRFSGWIISLSAAKALWRPRMMRKPNRNDRVQGRFPQFCGLLLS